MLHAIAASPQSLPTSPGRQGEASAEPNTVKTRHEPRIPVSPPTPLTVVIPCSPQASTEAASKYVPTEEWTSRLIDRGFTIAEAAAIRGLDAPMIVRHLTWMVHRGHPLSVETVLAPETIAAWDAWRLETERPHHQSLPTPSMSGPSSSRAGTAGREEFVSTEHVSVGPVSTFLLDLLVSQYPDWLCHGGFKSLERKYQVRSACLKQFPSGHLVRRFNEIHESAFYSINIY